MDSMTIHVDATFVPETRNGFSVTQAHWEVATGEYQAAGERIWEALEALRQTVGAAQRPVALEAWRVNIGRVTYQSTDAAMVAKMTADNIEECWREARAHDRDLAHRALVETVKKQAADNLPTGAKYYVGWDDKYQMPYLEVAGVSGYSELRHRSETIVEDRKFRVFAKYFSWSKVHEACEHQMLAQRNVDETYRAKQEAERIGRATREDLGKKYQSENVCIGVHEPGKVRLAFYGTPEQVEKALEALCQAGLVQKVNA